VARFYKSGDLVLIDTAAKSKCKEHISKTFLYVTSRSFQHLVRDVVDCNMERLKVNGR
jgi:hypothetical protein